MLQRIRPGAGTVSRPTIAWTRQKLADLKTAYEKAVAERQDRFTFVEKEGTGMFARKIAEHPLLVSYAKYLIEWLDGEFAAHPDQPARPNREGSEGQ